MPFDSQAFEQQNLCDMRPILEDLFTPDAKIFWSDLLLSAILGWTAFIFACIVPFLSWQMFGFMLIAVITLYRASVFIHELSHLRKDALPGFAVCWNCLMGIPLMLPAFIYLGVHADHHRPSTYGTEKDPEYLPFAGKPLAIVAFILQVFLIPGLLLLRFLILSPIGLIVRPVHDFLEKKASALTMNLAYSRIVTQSERKIIKTWELLILLAWSIPLGLMVNGILPWRTLGIWYGVTALIYWINALRTLGAHRYQSNTQSMNRLEQVMDSIDTPGSWLTTLWAPVGLRYHALHHYYPSLPYHNLAIAYRRLMTQLPSNDLYKTTFSSSLRQSLLKLWLG